MWHRKEIDSESYSVKFTSGFACDFSSLLKVDQGMLHILTFVLSFFLLIN